MITQKYAIVKEKSMDAIENLLTRGVDKIYPSKGALEKVLRSGKKLRLYQGFDPTGAQLHIGHAVALRKLRQFQDLGHEVIFLIGDFTARIGDPTGKLDSRQMLTKEQVQQNAQHYKTQSAKILRFDGPNPVMVKYNGDWLGTMSALEFLQLSHHLSYQQVIERDMFQNRMKQGHDIYVNELLYPVMQAYDSVAMNVDLEVGGTDQMFNMLMGRKLMRNMKRKEKFVMTVPLLTDASGVKIGKTEGNVIGLTDEPNEFFGKIMALGDNAILNCFLLLTDLDVEPIRKRLESDENPMVLKKQLAFELTKQFNSEKEAVTAQEDFEKKFQSRDARSATVPTWQTNQTDWDPAELLVATSLAPSKSEAKRLIGQGAVEINGETVNKKQSTINLNNNDIIKSGKKRFLKILRT